MFDSAKLMYSTGGGEFYSHPIEQSLRFNDDDSAYLSRTPASASNRKTWTWSGWVKLGNLTITRTLFAARLGTSDSDSLQIFLTSGDVINVGGYSYGINSSPLLRDASAWYHIVITYDTTEATDTNRIKLYVNGTQVSASGTFPSLNLDGAINNTQAHNIGRRPTNNDRYMDGYLAEVNFIDGQALDATSFGEFKSGVWIPKAYAGSYGTNGFYLDFGNSGSIGADVSGNGNNFTANNLAATDVVLDSPTNNFCTLNPLIAGGTFSEGNLKFIANNSRPDAGISTIGVSSGKYYWEVEANSIGADGCSIGILEDSSLSYAQQANTIRNTADAHLYEETANYRTNGTSSSYGATYTSGDVIGVALDLDAGNLTFYKNGVSQGVAASGLSGTFYPAVTDASSTGGVTVILNFGQDSSFAGNKTAQGNTDANGYGDFYYAPPTGYLALCTANLTVPDAMNPALDNSPQDYFNTVLYTGDGTSSHAITGVGFSPSLTWLKQRDAARANTLFDVVRGATKQISSNNTNAESTQATMLTSFDADGFTVGSDNPANISGGSFVSWNWKAGGSGVSNTDGSITSTVSANTDAGFSIVSYTGNGTNGASVGHGLSQTPDLYIIKNRDAAETWWVSGYPQMSSVFTTAYKFIQLESTNALSTAGGTATTATSTTITFTDSGAATNESGSDHVAYCFHSVEGFSKFGSYTGNGSADGPFVYTGFRPAFVLVKASSNSTSSTAWTIFDVERNTYNPALKELYPNSSSAELTDSSGIDILSNGFKLKRNSEYANYSGWTYIYMAFAEMPTKFCASMAR